MESKEVEHLLQEESLGAMQARAVRHNSFAQLRNRLEQKSRAIYSVFGDAFSFENGESDPATVTAFARERLEARENGETVWIPRSFGSEARIVADLWSDRKMIATLDVEYETNLLSRVYVVANDGQHSDTILCDGVSFVEAVQTAEQYEPLGSSLGVVEL